MRNGDLPKGVYTLVVVDTGDDGVVEQIRAGYKEEGLEVVSVICLKTSLELGHILNDEHPVRAVEQVFDAPLDKTLTCLVLNGRNAVEKARELNGKGLFKEHIITAPDSDADYKKELAAILASPDIKIIEGGAVAHQLQRRTRPDYQERTG